MRLYALLLGIALTGAYGYAAHVAVASANPGRERDATPVAPLPAGEGDDQVWYGGTIAPIIVESAPGVAQAAGSRRLLSEGDRACWPAAPRTHRAVT